ncbi:hypothetical protein IE4803_PB00118 (plasmid) [Rhizobium etli bv. phaseoli str. IE4803]|nr:hypothetical protein IE4803_PB00118 [Rhizobium etli bv. phaseoli str. IE4803]
MPSSDASTLKATINCASILARSSPLYNFGRRLKTLNGLTPRVRLQEMDFAARTFHPRSAP